MIVSAIEAFDYLDVSKPVAIFLVALNVLLFMLAIMSLFQTFLAEPGNVTPAILEKLKN